MLKRINILITCSSGKFTFDVVNALKSLNDFKIKIIGVDSNPKTNLAYLDEQYKISKSFNSKKYLKELFKICKKENIKIIFPLSEPETILYSKNFNLFKKKK